VKENRYQGIMVLTVPGMLKAIAPPHVHRHFDTLSSAGILAIMTVGAPGTHGAIVIGMHGMGVGTPIAAAVAAMTIGLAIELQTPNGMMFTIGMWSMMFAAGGPSHRTLFFGSTTRLDGAAPNVQVIIAPIDTWLGMFFSRANAHAVVQ
jgi:hypothetical protein